MFEAPLPYFYLFIILSEIVGSIAGFGSSTILLPIALFYFDFQTALVLAAVVHLTGNIGRLFQHKFAIDKKVVMFFGMTSLIFSLLGAYFVDVLPQELLKAFLGVFLVGYSLHAFWCRDFRIKQTNKNMFLGGGLSGFTAGLLGTGGALRAAFLMGFGLTKNKYVVAVAASAVATDMLRLPVYLYNGYMKKEFLMVLLPILVCAGVGVFLGNILLRHFSNRFFKNIVYVSLLIIGVHLIFAWLW